MKRTRIRLDGKRTSEEQIIDEIHNIITGKLNPAYKERRFEFVF